MHAITLIQAQLNGIHQIFHGVTDDITEKEWTQPVLPNTNLLAFTCWHLIRTRDWAVQTGIRGVPEVVADERWAGWGGLAQTGMGAGMSREQANLVAHQVTRTDVLAYADAVHSTIMDWLSSLTDDDLDTIPDLEAHMAPHPAYQLPGFREEIDGLINQPIWRLLSGPCFGHVREHVGEIELLKQVLRENEGS